MDSESAREVLLLFPGVFAALGAISIMAVQMKLTKDENEFFAIFDNLLLRWSSGEPGYPSDNLGTYMAEGLDQYGRFFSYPKMGSGQVLFDRMRDNVNRRRGTELLQCLDQFIPMALDDDDSMRKDQERDNGFHVTQQQALQLWSQIKTTQAKMNHSIHIIFPGIVLPIFVGAFGGESLALWVWLLVILGELLLLYKLIQLVLEGFGGVGENKSNRRGKTSNE